MNTGRPTLAGSGSCCHGNKLKPEAVRERLAFSHCLDVISSTQREQLQSEYTQARALAKCGNSLAQRGDARFFSVNSRMIRTIKIQSSSVSIYSNNEYAEDAALQDNTFSIRTRLLR